MRVTRLELRNFRCFESLQLDLDQTTVLVGANDTGKSTVLEALHWLFSPSLSCDWATASRRRPDSDPERPATLILAELGDLTPSEADAWRAVAPEGVIRVAKSSLTANGLNLAMAPSEVEKLVGAFDMDFCREALGVGDVHSVTEVLFRDGDFTRFSEDLVLVDFDIWELGRGESLLVLELLLYQQLLVIALGGPHDTAWSPRSVLEPIIRRRVSNLVNVDLELFAASPSDDQAASRTPVDLASMSFAGLNLGLKDLLGSASSAHTASLEGTGDFTGATWQSELTKEDVIEAVLHRLKLRVDVSGGGEPVAADTLGPGAQRALAIAALNLYRDPDLFPPSTGGFVLLLVEEPEMGLHPAAQRRLAKSLRKWATFGLQLVLVTHSPAFVNATDPHGVRLARRTGSAIAIERPVDLGEVRASLGVEPADILLARRFVIVEGDSDRAVLDSWARRLGLDLHAGGIQLVPCGGYAPAEQVTRFLGLAYPGADFMVVLDNGSDTARAQREITARHGDRVDTILLKQSAIEAYYHPQAIAAWLRLEGISADDLDRDVGESLARSPSRLKALNALCARYLGRQFEKLKDGMAIANLTPEHRIDPEIRTLLLHIGRDE